MKINENKMLISWIYSSFHQRNAHCSCDTKTKNGIVHTDAASVQHCNLLFSLKLLVLRKCSAFTTVTSVLLVVLSIAGMVPIGTKNLKPKIMEKWNHRRVLTMGKRKKKLCKVAHFTYLWFQMIKQHGYDIK